MTTKPPIDLRLSPTELESRILFDEGGVLVVNKPPGLVTAGKYLRDPKCLQHLLIRRHHGQMVWAVHQLDADTSGVNVFVRRKPLVPEYQERMRAPNGRKQYIGFIHGRLPEPQCTVDAPIGWVGFGDTRRWGIASKGKPARSHFREVAVSEDGAFSVIKVRIETGRTHQIRVHLEHLGRWLVGEPYYTEAPCELHERHALHAWRLRFADGAPPESFEAPLPDDLRALGMTLGLPLDGLTSALY